MDTRSRSSDQLTLIYALAMAAVAVICRLVPYVPGADRLWHVMPVGALALFAGSRLRTRWAVLVPLGAMLLSDLLLLLPLGAQAFDASRPIVYASFAVYVLIGRLVRQGELSPMVLGGAVLLGSLQFFVVTNFAYWLTGILYPRTLAGLAECYTMALPFYRGTLVGDLFFSGLIFGLHAVLVAQASRQKASQPA
jgi:hypothetical protein